MAVTSNGTKLNFKKTLGFAMKQQTTVVCGVLKEEEMAEETIEEQTEEPTDEKDGKLYANTGGVTTMAPPQKQL